MVESRASCLLSQGECVPEDRGEDELLSAVGGEVFVIAKYLCVFQVLACAFVGEIDRGGRNEPPLHKLLGNKGK